MTNPVTLHGALIELFEVDLGAVGGPVYRWCNSSNEFGSDIVWRNVTYTKAPIQAQGFEVNGGKLARPRLQIANVNQIIGGLARQNNDLVNCKVTRFKTFAKYLDAVNFINGNPNADPNVMMPPDIYYINQKVTENREMIEWELAASMDLEGVRLPRRTIIANICPWTHTDECVHVATCAKKLADCRTNWGANAELPFGGFPGAGLRRS